MSNCSPANGNILRTQCLPHESQVRNITDQACFQQNGGARVECKPICNTDERLSDNRCVNNDNRYTRAPSDNIKGFGSRSNINIANIKTSEAAAKAIIFVYDLLRKEQVDTINNNTFITDGKYGAESPSGIIFNTSGTFYNAGGVKPLRNFFAMKIYAFLTIKDADNYTFSIGNSINGQIKLFLNNFLIIDNTRRSFATYLNPGDYVLYIERTHDKTVNYPSNDDGALNQISLQRGTIIAGLEFFITKNFNLFNLALTSRDNATIKFCDSGAPKNFFQGEGICKTSRNGSTLLQPIITNVCFPNNAPLRNNNGVRDGLCKNLHNSPDLNTAIKTDLNDKYREWAQKLITTNTPVSFAADAAILFEYINDINPEREVLFGGTLASKNLTDYCEGVIGDNFSASATGNTMCDRLYTNNKYNVDSNIISSINKIQRKFCTSPGVNGKPRYETNDDCKKLIPTLLKDDIITRCSDNGQFKNSDQYCITLSNENIDSSAEPYKTITDRRITLLSKEIDEIAKDKPISSQSLEFAVGLYNRAPNKKLDDEVLKRKLFDYCETNEQNYPTNSNSQCGRLYNRYQYKQSVAESREKMRNELCKNPTNMLTSNGDLTKTNGYNCKEFIFDTNKNLAINSAIVNNYCSEENNITTNDCQTYYKDIENKIFNSQYRKELEGNTIFPTSIIGADTKLKTGTIIFSNNLQFYLIFARDGELQLYNKNKEILWKSDKRTTNLNVCELYMQSDGNLVVYEGNTALWSSNTSINPNAYVQVTNDGSLVIYKEDNTILKTFSKSSFENKINQENFESSRVNSIDLAEDNSVMIFLLLVLFLTVIIAGVSISKYIKCKKSNKKNNSSPANNIENKIEDNTTKLV